MTKRDLVAKHSEAILALSAEHGLADIRLFGSVARCDERHDSDIDFFVRRLPGSDPFLLLAFTERLTTLLGCKVDVIAEHSLMKPRLRNNILADAVPLEETSLFNHGRRLGEIEPRVEFGGERGTLARGETEI